MIVLKKDFTISIMISLETTFNLLSYQMTLKIYMIIPSDSLNAIFS